MKISFVTQWFPPEPGTLVAARIAKGLAARGHQVDIVTGFPNYPTGRVHDGYRLRPYLVEKSEGLNVHRCLLYPSHNRSSVQRALNYLSFAASASWGARRVSAPDVWLVYSSPATAALPALLASRKRRAPVCLLIQDLWPDSVVDSGFLASGSVPTVQRILHRFCDWTYRRAAAIGVISPSMELILRQRGVPQRKLFQTPNPGPSLSDLSGFRSAVSRADLGLPAGRLFMYAGNLGELQALEPVLQAFRQVPEASFVLVGDGVERSRLQAMVQGWGVPNIHFYGVQPADRAEQLIRAGDVSVLSLQDTPLLRATMPSKVQSVLGAGRPVLAHAAGDVADLVNRERCGWTAAPGDVAAMVDLIRTGCRASPGHLAAVGDRGRAYAAEAFSPDVVLDRLEAMMTAALRVEAAAA